MVANTPPFSTPAAKVEQRSMSIHRILGTLGMIGSPFLCLSFASNGFQAGDSGKLGAALGLVFTMGWLSNIAGLLALGAAGRRLPARILLGIQMVTVTFASIFQIFEFVSPGNSSVLYTITDISWPLSMLLLFITSIVIVFARVFEGRLRFLPLVAGIWLPLGIVSQMALGEVGGGIFAGVHSMIGWFLLGYVIYSGGKRGARR
jgi:hypothetical protein